MMELERLTGACEQVMIGMEILTCAGASKHLNCTKIG